MLSVLICSLSHATIFVDGAHTSSVLEDTMPILCCSGFQHDGVSEIGDRGLVSGTPDAGRGMMLVAKGGQLAAVSVAPLGFSTLFFCSLA